MGNSDESSLLFDQPGPKGLKRIRIINWVATILFVVVLVLIVLRLHNPPDGEKQLDINVSQIPDMRLVLISLEIIFLSY